MSTLLAEIEAAPWRRMFPASGRAIDTPEHLRNLLGDDADLHQVALGYLNGNVLHQGSAFPSAAMTTIFVARMLAEGLVSDRQLQLSLLDFLRYAAETGAEIAGYLDELRSGGPHVETERLESYLCWLSDTAYDDPPLPVYSYDSEAFSELLRLGQLNLYEVLPKLLDVLRPLAEQSDHDDIAAATLSVAAPLAQLPNCKEALVEYLSAAERLTNSPGVGVRAAAVLYLGRLGGNPHRHLSDPWLVVRGCAALATALADDPAAHGVLAEIIRAPRAFDAAVSEWPSYGRPVSQHDVVEAACERLPDTDHLVSGITAMTPGSVLIGGAVFDYLRRVFPAGWPTIAERTRAQHALARFVSESDRFWEPWLDGRRSAFLTHAGLPDDRENWRMLAEMSKNPGEYTADDLIVLEAGAAIRKHPHMYFGPANDGLGQVIIAQLTKAYDAAAAEQIVGSAAIRPIDETTFVLSVTRHVLPEDRLERILAGAAITDREPLDQLSLTSAMCSVATVTMYAEGQSLVQRFVCGTALGPAVPVDVEQQTDGYRIELTFDPAAKARL